MLSFLFNILCQLAIISSSLSPYQSNNIDHVSSINQYHRLLLSNTVYNYVTNITLEITSITSSDPYTSIIDTIYQKLNYYYNATYNSSLNYNLSINTYTTSLTTNSIELILILYTKHIITRHDIITTQTYIDNNIAINNLYIINITHFTEHRNSGHIKDNELEIEILIIVFVIIFIIIFIGVWIWRWRQRIYYGKAEVYFLDDYKDNKPNEQEFPDIELKDNDTVTSDRTISTDKKEKQIEMVMEKKDNKEIENVNDIQITGNEVYNDDGNASDNDPEIEDQSNKDSDNDNEVRDEDDEKAEELKLPETMNNGENILIEDDD